MKNIDEIFSSVEKDLAKFEEKRLSIKEKEKGLPLLIAPSVVCFILGIIGNSSLFFIGAVVGLPFLVKGLSKLTEVMKLKNEYTYKYKNEVVAKVIKSFDEEYEYNPASGISKSEYLESKIFTTRPDRYSTEDLVEGKYGNRGFKFAEIHSEYKTETRDKDGHRHVHWHTIFKGIFFIGEFNKNFNGYTLIYPDTAEKMLGIFGKSLQKLSFKGKLITLEDPEFEKEFAVYSDDEVESRYILSTSLMRRILDYKIKNGKGIHLGFVDNKIYVAISNMKDCFEPDFSKSALDKTEIESYYNDLKVVLDIIEEFNLDQKVFKN
ncbi:MAG: DUF3137 domain-containing protein [Clostridia bacterium]|jgi:hypothetical protein|nr:DUF3137 domain-containing protein [Clostridia bacterium]